MTSDDTQILSAVMSLLSQYDSDKQAVCSHRGGYEEFYHWDMTPCSPLKFNRRFGGTCLHLHLRRISQARNQLEQATSIWRRKQHIPPKHLLHGVISRKTEHFITTDVRTSDPTCVGAFSPSHLQHCPVFEPGSLWRAQLSKNFLPLHRMADSDPSIYTYSELLVSWTLSTVRYSRSEKTQRFGNWICFRPQVRGRKTHSQSIFSMHWCSCFRFCWLGL
jgi:hypothetical protein